MKDRENHLLPDEDEEGGRSTTGGQTGDIDFRLMDILTEKPRDDNLPPADLKKFLAAHEAKHKQLVDFQRDEMKARAALKEGKKVYNQNNNYGLENNNSNDFKTHWLAAEAQFSGARDNKVTNVPTQNEATTNNKNKEELNHKLNYRPGHRPLPRLIR